LITAQHVVKNRRGTIEFQFLGETQWRLATVLWENDSLDVAVLESKESFPASAAPLFVSADRFPDRVESIAYGFPSFGVEVDKQDGQKICNEYSLEGWIKPKDLSATKNPKKLEMEINGFVPDDTTSWKGISGSVAFARTGGMIGVVLEYPKNRKGRQFYLISLAWVYENCPEFRQIVIDHVGQIDYEPSIEERRRKIYSIRQQLDVLERRKCDNRDLERQLKRELEELKGDEQLTGRNPELDKLKQVIETIKQDDSRLLDRIWTPIAPLQSREKWSVGDIHNELCVSLDLALIPSFLDRAIELLQRKDPIDGVTALIDQLQNLLPLFPQPEPQAAKNELPSDPTDTQPAPSNVTSLLLFGLEIVKIERDRVEYSLSIHHVPDSTAYQQRVKKGDSLEETAKPLTLSADKLRDLDVQPADRNQLTFSAKPDDVDVIREILNTTVQAVFDTYPELEDDQPHIYFYLPKSLLTIDCHNFNFDCDDGYLRLGRQHPVAIACLDRHKQPRSSKPRGKWEKRWKDRNDAPKALRDHICSCDKQLKELNSEFLSFDDRNILSSQLQILDREKGKIIGLQFTENNLRFQVAYETFFLVGLSLLLYPSSPLTPTEMDRLSQVLGETCIDRFLVAIKDWYRIHPESHDAGSLSVLMDNPYLPLPEIDYF
jgi:hypothetical protein